MIKPAVWQRHSDPRIPLVEIEYRRLLELQRMEREREMAKRDAARGIK